MAASNGYDGLRAVSRVDSEVDMAPPDVQALLRKVSAAPSFWYTRSYPEAMRCNVIIKLKGGKKLVRRQKDYSGLYARPMSKEDVQAKFHSLAANAMPAERRRALIECVLDLENRSTTELLGLLNSATRPATA